MIPYIELKYRWTIFFALLLVNICWNEAFGNENVYSLGKIFELEAYADQGRKLFWKGNYDKAQQIFIDLSSKNNPSSILYHQESGICALANGDSFLAKQHFVAAANMLENFPTDVKREEKALSVFGSESEKVYRGDPYERVSLYTLLALLFISELDYDNALAACKNGLMAGSDAGENLFESDLTFLHALSAKINQMRDDITAFEKNIGLAIQSSLYGLPEIRDFVSIRLELVTLLKMSSDERIKLGEKRTEEELINAIQLQSVLINEKVGSLNSAGRLGPFVSGDFNTIIVIPRGKGIEKVWSGSELESIKFASFDSHYSYNKIIKVNDILISEYQPNFVCYNVNYQAANRGGRRMDSILKEKASYRRTTASIGTSVGNIGGLVGGTIGLGVSLIGAIAQGLSANMTAESDIRNWKTLPELFEYFPLNLPAGTHVISQERSIYFKKDRLKDILLDIPSDFKGIKVVFISPDYHGICPSIIINSSEKDKQMIANTATYLLTPILGVDEFINVNNLFDNTPELIYINQKNVMREMRKIVKGRGIELAFASQKDIDELRSSNNDRVGHALQCEIVSINKKKDFNKKVYEFNYIFSIIKVPQGNIIYSSPISHIIEPIKGGASTVFSSSISSATDEFIMKYLSK